MASIVSTEYANKTCKDLQDYVVSDQLIMLFALDQKSAAKLYQFNLVVTKPENPLPLSGKT
jgi:hypothetical protein